MPLEFTVLASGSAGNASLLEADGFSLLIDAGLGPRQLASRLTAVGASWRQIQAVLLTHLHSDHWKEATLAHLRRLRIPLYCHAEHHASFSALSDAFTGMLTEQLVRPYQANHDFLLGSSLLCRPLSLRHDGGPTFGFRFEASSDLFGQPWALAYAADLGSWTPELADALADIDLLALEFNHDVHLEHASGRSRQLIARVLGDEGHLSNAQAAALLREVMRCSEHGRLQHVVQLHLSRDCNRPELAAGAVREVLAAWAHDIQVHTASQYRPGPKLVLGVPSRLGRPARRQAHTSPKTGRTRATSAKQVFLPGFEDLDGRA